MEGGDGEDTAVEADDGDFDGGADEKIGKLVGEEDLGGWVGLVRGTKGAWA